MAPSQPSTASAPVRVPSGGSGRRAAPSERDRNRARTLEVVLAHGPLTRAGIAGLTHLSRASVTRVIDELLADGLLAEMRSEGPATRGRPALTLVPAPGLGHVVGVDMGSGTFRALAWDLAGAELSRIECDTPSALEPRLLAAWIHEQVLRLLADGGLRLERTLRMTMSVPSKVSDDGSLVRPAPVVAHLEGPELFTELNTLMSLPLSLFNDAHMALRGEMLTDASVELGSAVLVISSNGLGASASMDGTVIPGSSGALGELGRIPMGGGLTVWDGLSLHGLTRRAGQLGLGYDSPYDLLDTSRDDLAELHRGSREAMVVAVCAITLCFDPAIIVFTGRMLPLLEVVLAQVIPELEERLPKVPEIRLAPVDDFLATRGCAAQALASAQGVLVEAARSGLTSTL